MVNTDFLFYGDFSLAIFLVLEMSNVNLFDEISLPMIQWTISLIINAMHVKPVINKPVFRIKSES